LGRETGQFFIKKVYYVRTKEKDEDGNYLYRETYTPPSKETVAKDRETRKKIKELTQKQRDLLNEGTPENFVEASKLTDEISSLNEQIQVRAQVNESLVFQRTGSEQKQHQVKVIEDGAEYVIEYSNERIANALNRNFGKDATRFYTNMQKATGFMSSIMTQYNPSFAAVNLVRDMGTAINSNLVEFGAEYTGRFIKNAASAHAAIWKYAAAGKFTEGENGKMLREFFEDGAATGYSFLNDVQKLQTNMRKAIDQSETGRFFSNAGDGIKNVFSMLTEASELNTRFAQYKTSREMGYTRQQAATHAKEVTVNFDRKGTARFWRSMFAFFNAAVQGSNKFLRMMKNTRMRALLIANFALYAAFGFLNTLLAPDDPDDEKAWGEYDRMQNIVFGHYKIPLPQVLRAFWGMGVQAALAWQGKKTVKAALMDGTVNFLNETTPNSALNFWNGVYVDENTNTVKHILELDDDAVKAYIQSIAPTSISPIVDIAVNRDFAGRTVQRVPYTRDKQETMPDVMLGKKNVNPLAQKFANKLFELGGGDLNAETRLKKSGTDYVPGLMDVNPSSVEHLVTGYTAGVGKFVLELYRGGKNALKGEVDFTDMIVANRFIKPYSEDSAYGRAYWNLKGKFDAYEKGMDEMSEAKPAEYLDIATNPDNPGHRMFQWYVDANSALSWNEPEAVKDKKEAIKELDSRIVEFNKLK
jgi:hypothetical protein